MANITPDAAATAAATLASALALSRVLGGPAPTTETIFEDYKVLLGLVEGHTQTSLQGFGDRG